MLKAAIEKIQAMSKPVFQEIEGRMFCVGRDGEANEVRPSLDLADTLPLTSLDALVKMIKTEAVKKHAVPFYVMIPDHLTVRCFTQPDKPFATLDRFSMRSMPPTFPAGKKKHSSPSRRP